MTGRRNEQTDEIKCICGLQWESSRNRTRTRNLFDHSTCLAVALNTFTFISTHRIMHCFTVLSHWAVVRDSWEFPPSSGSLLEPTVACLQVLFATCIERTNNHDDNDRATQNHKQLKALSVTRLSFKLKKNRNSE